MDNQVELENIEKQILSIKSNSEYLRLLTAHRGLRDDQRFKAYTLRLTTLGMKRDKLSMEKNNQFASKLTKPLKRVTVERTINIQPKPEPSVQAPSNHLRKIVHESLVNIPTPRGKVKAKPASKFSTASRTITRPIDQDQKSQESQELMIKPTRTSIKPDKVPVSKLTEIKARSRARTLQPTKQNKLERIESLDNIESIEDLLDEDF